MKCPFLKTLRTLRSFLLSISYNHQRAPTIWFHLNFSPNILKNDIVQSFFGSSMEYGNIATVEIKTFTMVYQSENSQSIIFIVLSVNLCSIFFIFFSVHSGSVFFDQKKNYDTTGKYHTH